MKIQINKTAPVQCATNIFIQAKPELVWNILTHIMAWPQWQTDISQVQIQNPIEPGTDFKWKTGGARINSTLHTVTPLRELGWTGKTFGLFAVHNWRLEAQDGGTLLKVEESMEGVLAQWFKKSFNRNLEKGMAFWLNSLKTACENKA